MKRISIEEAQRREEQSLGRPVKVLRFWTTEAAGIEIAVLVVDASTAGVRDYIRVALFTDAELTASTIATRAA